MLSDRERETLCEIQRRLVTDDPDFERSFRAVAVPPPDHRWLAYAIVLVVVALLGTVMALAGAPAAALAFAATGGLIWSPRHHRGNADRRQQR
ncbi:MAG: DUF3040 domain-containing protein [Actinophytocola sp.]|uniref:DUF3040 domain-containing protein n=1 Tax=Actinophytocola sp. TaxID=1872138 RepID=UPI001320B6E3|nr:DUF3040 domain-containing protein [Actinophytocola sp.]MPZ78935.1 DUF3040 domain-containing protein [Actinophytocola sp.]